LSQTDFSTLNLNTALLDNLKTLEYLEMTPIQAQSLPPILDAKDVIAQGKTGSGKTAAFALGMLQNLDVKNLSVQSLVLCPTRELADQVATEVRRLGRGIPNIKVITLCGGMPSAAQVASLEYGAHIVVGTPGRIEDHLSKAKLNLAHLNTFVLDEADRMLDMGFQTSLEAIINELPAKRQTLLFSATFSSQIQSIAKRIMNDPVSVEAVSAHDNSTIQQHLYKIDNEIDRLTAVRLLLMKHRPESAVIFCKTKKETSDISDELRRYGFDSLSLNGDLEQRDRDQVLVRFANKSISILVATDVAARGLDIEALDLVINYQMAHDTEVHVHRVGRTGRAGSKGFACTLYAENEHHKLAQLEEYLGQRISPEKLPGFEVLEQEIYRAAMVTLRIDAGKKQKIRPGDILGALTAEGGIAGNQVGKIQVANSWSYVAVNRGVAKAALKKLSEGKLKGRSYRARQI